jgi:hypothetical protein
LYALVLFYTFKDKSQSDTSMFRLKLLPPPGQSILSFAEGTNLWEEILNAGIKNSVTSKIIETSLFDAIENDNGREGRDIKNRLQATIKINALTEEFSSWEHDEATHILLLDASVRELALEDSSSGLGKASVKRRTPINVNNTSMFEDQLDNEQLNRYSNYLVTYSEEDSQNAQYLMDLDHSTQGTEEDLQVSSFPMQSGRNNHFQQHYPNSGRGNGGSGRFPPSYNRGQPTSAVHHTSCMSCGGPHPFTLCAYKMELDPHQSHTLARVDLYRLDPNKLKQLDYTEAMNIVQSSTNNGNMKYQSETYRTNLNNMLQLNNEQRKRAAIANKNAAQTPDIVVASCRMAISASVGNNVHTPPHGFYNGTYGPRPQQKYTNGVLAHSMSDIRQATDAEINLHLATNTSDNIFMSTPLPTSPASINQVSSRQLSSTAICLVDPGATPTVIRQDLATALGLLQEQSHVRLGIAGVHGDVRYVDTVCWITITFQCLVQITVMAVIVPTMNSPVLIGQTDFKRNCISHISAPNVLIFGNHLHPSHTEKLMSEEEIRSSPSSGFVLNGLN